MRGAQQRNKQTHQRGRRSWRWLASTRHPRRRCLHACIQQVQQRAGSHLAHALPPARPPRRREWEDATRRALGSRNFALAGLVELLTAAGDVGADEGTLAEGLR